MSYWYVYVLLKPLQPDNVYIRHKTIILDLAPIINQTCTELLSIGSL